MDNLLEIRNLKVQFFLGSRTFAAVNGADLDIRGGETLVLAGESGSGKTVTALSITRMLPPNGAILEGRIRFNGEDVLAMDEESLRGVRGKEIAYIFQEPASYLNPVITVGDQIAEAVMLHQRKTKQEAGREAERLLGLVKIEDPRRVSLDYPHQLSGGMNQRAFIAMSLACRPRLLIADEPTTSLDVTIEAQILALLMELKAALGFSLLFITHNLSIAKRIADRVCVMYRGKVVETAATSELFTSPRHFHTKELIAAYEKIGRI